MKMKNIIALFLLIAPSLSAFAQEIPTEDGAAAPQEKKEKKAWELGIGGTVFQFSRVSFSNFTQLDDGYAFDLDLSHAVWGGGIYAARELSKHFYLDLQGNIGLTRKAIEGKNKLLVMAGLGLQWRLGEYFKSHYVDPYLRAGINYMYKDFSIIYDGTEGLAPDQMSWILSNYANKEGRDRKHLTPIALGGGVNLWLNDHFGIGLQADYLIMPYKNIANSLQGSARLLWRIGGKSKKPKPIIQYIEKPVDRIVEKQVIVEKPVETVIVKYLSELFDQIYFDFDSYRITGESQEILDKIADIFKRDTTRRYLITGQTDARGSNAYNLTLSENRAREVVKELEKRGVPSYMMKSRGVGKKIAIAPASATDTVRRGDRRITVETITNMEYWNKF